MDEIAITIIMPVHNGGTTLNQVFDSLEKQNSGCKKLIIIDDNSTDDSLRIIETYKARSRCEIDLIRNTFPMGLAGCLNLGIQKANTDYVITLHQDCILKADNEINNLMEPILRDKTVVAVYSHILLPKEVWDGYNFWLKAQYAQWVGKKTGWITGKFDCFHRGSLLQAGLFDNQTFHAAGEDVDISIKLKRIGKIADSSAEIIHLHNQDPDYSFKDYINKNNQFAQAYGALIRKHGLSAFSFLFLASIFWRPVLALAILISGISIPVLSLSILLIVLYKYKLFFSEYKDARIWVFLFTNLLLIFVFTYYFINGFIFKKQTI
jgi:GT2 family glycosyltransferase